MFSFSAFSLLSLLAVHVHAHASIQHPSMYGFNVTQSTFPYDNRAVAPLMDLTFDKWWFHGLLEYPPNPGDFFELPAGKPATTEIACDKGATSFFTTNPGGDVRQGNNPCPNPDPAASMAAIHTTGINDLTGCALAIAYKSDVNQVQPEDFVVFSVNHTCVWTRFTDFQVPADMPPCPPGGCHCAWFWIHSPDSGNEQNYMTGFKCNVTGSTSNVALATPQVPRRCGADPANGVPNATPGNCTYGAKSPFYWFQAERNNMFEGAFSPPIYTDLYNFHDGSQDDIFEGYYESIPPPSPNQTALPQPKNQSNNSSMPPVPSSSTPSSPTPSSSTPSSPAPPSPTSSSSTPYLSPSNGPSSYPGTTSPTPSPPPPPASTDTDPVFTVLLPPTSTPTPSPSSNSDPGIVINLNKRQPMPMKRMMTTASNLKRRPWGSRRSMLNAKMRM